MTNKGNLIAGVLGGIAAGIAIGVLLAPDSGANTREKIAHLGEDYLAELECRYDDFISMVRKGMEVAKDQGQELLQSKAKEGKDYLDKTRSVIKESTGGVYS